MTKMADDERRLVDRQRLEDIRFYIMAGVVVVIVFLLVGYIYLEEKADEREKKATDLKEH